MKQKKMYCADLFCGGGGTSSGMIQAFIKAGIPYELFGINHWKIAIATNRINHPDGYYQQDSIENISPRNIVPGGYLDYLWASPECTNHSRAKGGRPKDAQSRSTAWHVLKWAQELYIRRIFIENVEEFLEWGPLYRTMRPNPARKGKTFQAFINVLKSLDYKVEWRIMNAADYGAPTCRKRLIIQAVRGSAKIQWPEPTHAKEADLFRKKWVPAKEIIDWTVPGKSIFGRCRPLVPNTLRRMYSGIAKNGGRYKSRIALALRAEIARSCEFHKKDYQKICAELPEINDDVADIQPFITVMRGTAQKNDMACIKAIETPIMSISTKQHEALVEAFVTRYNGGDARNHSVSLPVPVIDCSNRYALVEPFVFATGHTSSSGRITSISSPISTIVTKAEHCIVSPLIISRHFNNIPITVDNPCPVIVCNGNIDLCEPLCISLRGTGKSNLRNSAVTVSHVLPTITAGGLHLSVAVPLIVSHHFNNQPGTVNEPIPTITTVGNFSIAEPFVLNLEHTAAKAVMRSVAQPLRTVTCQNKFPLIEPFLVPFFGESQKQFPRTHSVCVPLPTVTGHGAGGVVEALFIPQHGGGSVKSVMNPLSTITTTGSISVIEPMLLKYYGNEQSVQDVNAPLGTVTTKERFGLASGRLFVDSLGNFVMIDILFRMLMPRELALAMSFSREYKFSGTTSDQVKQIGNAVPPVMAEALIAATLSA